MAEVYCPNCGGMVNNGGVCPMKERPDNCPIPAPAPEKKKAKEDK